MLGLFEGSLVIGLGGLVGMAGLQFTHHGTDGCGHGGGHAGDGGGVHLGDAGHGMHIGDAGHGVHLGDAGHGIHVGDAGHGLHLGDISHALRLGGGHGAHVGDAGHAGHAGDIGHSGDAGHAGHGESGHGHSDASHHGDASGENTLAIKAPFWLLPSPIKVFSVLIGFGLAGIVFRELTPALQYEWLLAVAVLTGVVFERFMVRPYWSFLFRFASTPAGLLQSVVATKAIAVTTFNRSGCGLVRICVDGESRDVLARLVPQERGAPVHKGDSVLIEGANADDSVLVSRALPAPGSSARAAQ